MDGDFKKRNPCPYHVRSCPGRGLDGCPHGSPSIYIYPPILRSQLWMRQLADYYAFSVSCWKREYRQTRSPKALHQACYHERRRVMYLRLLSMGLRLDVRTLGDREIMPI